MDTLWVFYNRQDVVITTEMRWFQGATIHIGRHYKFFEKEASNAIQTQIKHIGQVRRNWKKKGETSCIGWFPLIIRGVPNEI